MGAIVTREETVAYARAVAGRQHVRVTDDWYDFVPLEDFPVVESV